MSTSTKSTRLTMHTAIGLSLNALPVGQTILLVGLAMMFAVFFTPISHGVLDALIVLNFAASFLLFFTAVTIKTPLEFVTFPTLLLFSTALRLGISLASAKLIFQDANAGRIIEAFGNLIAGGNVVKGAVIYLMIFVVSFLVISKGSERAAEVAARFTLDAMPGKQMSIDADLRAGLINGDKARQLRADLGMESSLHGAMDGAMKFVKGDAIAGVIIVLISAVAGMAIGVGTLNMSWGEAAARYTVLSVGEGMVAQLASLIISLAAATQITRIGGTADSVGTLGGEIGKELGRYPQALILTAIVMFAIGAAPGFPLIPFWSLGFVIALLVVSVYKRKSGEIHKSGIPMPSLRREGAQSIPHFGATGPEDQNITLRLDRQLVSEVDALRLDFALGKTRDALKRKLGIPFPGLHVEFVDGLPLRSYVLLTGEASIDSGICPTKEEEASSFSTVWSDIVPANSLNRLPNKSWSIEWYLSAKIINAVALNASRFVGVQEVQNLLNNLGQKNPDLVQELLREVPITKVAESLRRLAGEGISIYPIRDIAESLLYWFPREQDMIAVVELVRIDLGAYTAHRWMDNSGTISVVALDPDIESEIRDNINQSTLGVYLAIEPERGELIAEAIAQTLKQMNQLSPEKQIVLICSYEIRRHVSKLVDKKIKATPVLSFQEVVDHASIETLALVSF
jgi:type III secretion protein V